MFQGGVEPFGGGDTPEHVGEESKKAVRATRLLNRSENRRFLGTIAAADVSTA